MANKESKGGAKNVNAKKNAQNGIFTAVIAVAAVLVIYKSGAVNFRNLTVSPDAKPLVDVSKTVQTAKPEQLKTNAEQVKTQLTTGEQRLDSLADRVGYLLGEVNISRQSKDVVVFKGNGLTGNYDYSSEQLYLVVLPQNESSVKSAQSIIKRLTNIDYTMPSDSAKLPSVEITAKRVNGQFSIQAKQV